MSQSHTKNEIKNAICNMVLTNNNRMYLHSETIAATEHMRGLSYQALCDLHHEVRGAINNPRPYGGHAISRGSRGNPYPIPNVRSQDNAKNRDH